MKGNRVCACSIRLPEPAGLKTSGHAALPCRLRKPQSPAAKPRYIQTNITESATHKARRRPISAPLPGRSSRVCKGIEKLALRPVPGDICGRNLAGILDYVYMIYTTYTSMHNELLPCSPSARQCQSELHGALGCRPSRTRDHGATGAVQPDAGAQTSHARTTIARAGH